MGFQFDYLKYVDVTVSAVSTDRDLGQHTRISSRNHHMGWHPHSQVQTVENTETPCAMGSDTGSDVDMEGGSVGVVRTCSHITMLADVTVTRPLPVKEDDDPPDEDTPM